MEEQVNTNTTQEPTIEQSSSDRVNTMSKNKELDENLRRLLIVLCDSLKNATNVIMLPTADNIKLVLELSAGLFVLNLICYFLKIYTFISWEGSLVNLVLMLVIFLIQKGKDNELSSMYRAASVYVKKIKRRAASASKGRRSTGSVRKSNDNSKSAKRSTRKNAHVGFLRNAGKSKKK